MAISACDDNCEKGYIAAPQLVPENGKMSPEDMHRLGYLSDPQLSPDGHNILYGITYTSIEENRSNRNLWLCNADGSGKVPVSRYASSVNAARWSKDMKHIFFLQDGQLWKAPFYVGQLGEKVKLTDVEGGISDYRLSPDENSLYYISSIPGPVSAPKDEYPDLDKARAYVTDQLMYRHWDHWVTETPHTYVANLCNGIITKDNSIDILGADVKFELPTEPFGGAEQLDWAPDSRHIVYSCRKKTGIEYAFSTNTSIYIYDVLTGEEIAVTETGGYDTDPAWSPDGSHIAWISMERDGYEADRQRLFTADVIWEEPAEDGQSFGLRVENIRELASSLDADVAGIAWTDDGSSIIFPAVVDAVQALFSVNVDDNAPIVQRLTPEDWWFGFDKPFGIKRAEEGLTLLTTYQSNLFPSEMVKVTVPDSGEPSYEAMSHENDAYFAAIGQVRQEKVMLDCADGSKMLCWVLYPPEFTPDKKWPAIEMFNGGPQSTLDQSWSRRWNFFLMAQQGYVVILPNRHGCSGLGQAWKEQISGDYQGLNMQDYLTAGRWIKNQSWCGKLAGVGASYGGFSVYNLMGLHGDLYDCFIAHAGIFSEKMLWYTTEEVWFGNWDNGGLTQYAYEPGQTGPKGDGVTFGGMQQAGAPYAVTAKARKHYTEDPESKITKWHTPILCIHGMLDFRIPYEQGMAAFNAAQMMGVPSKLIIFPEETHWVVRPQNCIFWQREYFKWLEKWLGEE
ncbi:MAG: prolyl oligopeptidase family serine peptidase [Bacteroidales bacterium]|nr:prolyl oligopeptidase family serine peptidase [Bacteroidales bacterium]